MPDPAWYPQQADLERKVGGAFVLVELSGSSTGTADSTFVDSCLAFGRATVRAAVMVKHATVTLDGLDAETTNLVRRLAIIESARAAWSDGTGNQAQPANLAADFEWSDGQLDKIREGRIFIGGHTGQPAPALAQAVGVIDSDPLGCKVSINGFKRGFR